jgi:hypothetical protein
MATSSLDDALFEKWKERTEHKKAEVIATFLNEYGEHATWEEWITFLHKHQVNSFEWTLSVD